MMNIYHYAVSLGVPLHAAWEMIAAGQRTIQETPVEIPVQPTPFGFTFPSHHPAMQPPTGIAYELPDTSIPSPDRHMLMNEGFMATPSPLRFGQQVDSYQQELQPPPAPIFTPVEGPPVRESLEPLVVSSTGPVESRLVTTPPPHRGTAGLNTIPEVVEADGGQEVSMHSENGGNASGGGDGHDANMRDSEW